MKTRYFNGVLGTVISPSLFFEDASRYDPRYDEDRWEDEEDDDDDRSSTRTYPLPD